MKSLRSSFGLLLVTFGAALLFANCKVTSVESDESCTPNETRHCTCTNGDDGSQVCNSKGTAYNACRCEGTDGGGSANNGSGGDGNTATEGGHESDGGTAGSSTGGTANGGSGGTAANGGAAGSTSAAAGMGGEGGANFDDIDPTDCAACLAQLCPTQWQACEADANCQSPDLDGSGQYERIQNQCVEPERRSGVVKRDVVRGCGVSIGRSTDPDYLSDWAPEDMAQSTIDLMNCMAMGSRSPDGSWANDPNNFPVDDEQVIHPVPWPDGTCAKLACTSKVE
jgi:hypothetical protein